MTAAVIVQARLGSYRLPAKVTLPLTVAPGVERTVLEEVLLRCKRVPGVDVVVCAMPSTLSNRTLLTPLARRAGAEVIAWDGPQNDVLGRYAYAARAVGADAILRVTSDCPLIDPDVCGLVLDCVKNGPALFACNNEPRSFPVGFDCEAFGIDALLHADAHATDPEDREHVSPFIRRVCSASMMNVAAAEDRSHLRWTLDTEEDYAVIRGIFEEQMREAA